MKRFIKLISVVFSALVLFASLAACDNLGISSEELGNKDTFTYQVLSDSMNPVFKAGDIITLKRVEDASTLKVGDIICYYTIINGERVLNIHRIVNVYQGEGYRFFETKGDNNDMVDPLTVHEKDIVGVYCE